MLNVRLSTFEFVELNTKCVEDAAHTRMVRQHHAAYFVRSGHVGALLCQCNLDGSWTPRNEVG